MPRNEYYAAKQENRTLFHCFSSIFHTFHLLSGSMESSESFYSYAWRKPMLLPLHPNHASHKQLPYPLYQPSIHFVLEWRTFEEHALKKDRLWHRIGRLLFFCSNRELRVLTQFLDGNSCTAILRKRPDCQIFHTRQTKIDVRLVLSIPGVCHKAMTELFLHLTIPNDPRT